MRKFRGFSLTVAKMKLGKIILLHFLFVHSIGSHSPNYESEFLVDFLNLLSRSSCIFVDEPTGLGDLARNYIASGYITSDEDIVEYLIEEMLSTKEKIVVLLRDYGLGAYMQVFDTAPSVVSKFTWVALLNGTFDPRGITEVPYDCEFYIVRSDVRNRFEIAEMFTMKNTKKVFSKTVGIWTPETGLSMPNQIFFSRRMDLEGYPMNALVMKEECESDIQCSFFEIWYEIARYMNITTELVPYSSWETSAGMNLSYDVFLEPSTFDAYSVGTIAIAPIWKLTVHMYVKRVPENEFSRKSYFPSFKSGFSATLSLWVVVVSVCLTFFDYCYWRLNDRRCFEKLNGTFAVLFWICNQGGVQVETSLSALLAVLAVRSAVLIMHNFVSMLLVSFLTLQVPVFPFDDVEGFLRDDTYQLATVNKSFVQEYFVFSPIPWESVFSSKFLGTNEMPRNLQEGADKICAEEKVVFLAYSKDFQMMGPEKCQILKVPNEVAKIFCGILLENGSPFQLIFNSVYIHFLEFGIAAKMGRFINGRLSPKKDIRLRPIMLHQVHPFFVLLLFGLAVAVALCIGERMVHGALSRYPPRRGDDAGFSGSVSRSKCRRRASNVHDLSARVSALALDSSPDYLP